MKIAIIGTHSTGKTTIIRSLAETLRASGKTAAILPEFARLCPFPIDEGTTYNAQAWIQEEQVKEEAAHEHGSGILICDRATLDNFAYMHRACHDTRDLSDIEKRAAEHMATYDAIFKTQQLLLPAEDDGVRPVESETYETFRTHIDELIHHFLNKHQVNFHLLPPSPEYSIHVAFILQKIQKALATLVPAPSVVGV